MMSTGEYLPDDLVLTARREEIEWHILKVSVTLSRC